MPRVTKEQAQKLVGKTIYAVRKDGSVVTGKLVRMHQNQLQLVPVVKGKEVQTRAIIPLVLFDLLAIGLFAGGGFGFGGFGPGFGPGFGGPGFGPGFGGPGFGGPGFGPGPGFDGGCCCQPGPGFVNTPFF
ncbi:hypothetical protein GZH47_22500 [Paenibacillus rhizovicinus]|uniref:50S ribosomal protein L33 n=1 Tax=Paenibacillus rhizovicinus TaxID=2704463 RepID=A0A6C0P4V3_9BACL|nr:hypothetical protein [Paenibacillus rhizovicinus]QHW33286.1 hypothetical protein GZH47_22500 [Paenibacillus rhizovicinus]